MRLRDGLTVDMTPDRQAIFSSIVVS